MEKFLRNRLNQVVRNQTDKSLKWKQDINHMAVELNKINFMLSKLRHNLNQKP